MKTSLSGPGPTLDTPPPQSPCIPVLWVLSTQPGPWMLTASQDKESYLPHSWFPAAYSVTAPEGSLRNFLPEWTEVCCTEESTRAGCVIMG